MVEQKTVVTVFLFDIQLLQFSIQPLINYRLRGFLQLFCNIFISKPTN